MTNAELLKKLISFKSITPSDGGSFEFIKSYLDDFKYVEINKNGIKNLYVYKDFVATKNNNSKHVSFAGHLDVVPAGDGWQSEPFEPLEKDGVIYGRGAQDMKSGVTAFMNAVKKTKSFNGRISLILTSDEEGDGEYGTLEVLKYLKEKNELPDYAIVAEPTCEKIFGDMIKVGRRGSINGVLELIGKQGHAAYPEKSINPVHQIAKILPNIAGAQLDSGDEFFAPSKFVITDIRAGMEVTNVTPGKLKMMFNVRNSTKTTKEDIENFVNNNFKGLDYTLKLTQGSKPFITNKDSLLIGYTANAIKKITGVDTRLATTGGTSDARFFGEFGIQTVEFGVVNDTIHAPNERTTVEELNGLEEVFLEIIKSF